MGKKILWAVIFPGNDGENNIVGIGEIAKFIHRRAAESAELRRENPSEPNGMNRNRLNELGAIILDACITVHRILGPGLLESVYVYALIEELKMRGLRVETNVCVPLIYKGIDTGKYFEIDILVEGEIILEIKSCIELNPVFFSQLISYLRLSDKRLGYLINFNCSLLKEGFHRFVNKF